MTTVFKDDDSSYLQWKQTYTDGYIVNTTRNPSRNYLVLHRVDCPSLDPGKQDLNWTREYIKICSADVRELQQWAQQYVSPDARLSHCP